MRGLDYLRANEFEWVAAIDVELKPTGEPIHEFPQASLPREQIHPKANGPFCRLKLPALPKEPGVYVIVIDDRPVYVGVASDSLAKRWGHYKRITKSKCRRGSGQPTNCRINHEILNAHLEGRAVALWFRKDRTLEQTTKDDLNPPLNER